MTIDGSLIAYVVNYSDLVGVQRAGISADYFVDEWRSVFRYIHRMSREHDAIPSADTVLSRFPDIELPRVRRSELPMLIADIKQRRKHLSLLELMLDTSNQLTDQDTVDDVIQDLQGKLNALSYSNGAKSHLVDLFAKSTSKTIAAELTERKAGRNRGIPSGLPSFDTIAGGLHKGRMITAIARSGIGKSWLDLWFVANAVSAGAKVILYPLEMTLFETATRLYTIFSQMHFGAERVLKNYDLTSGKISMARIARFTSALEDKFKGQLYIADVASLADPYTNERIEAEVTAHKPDMFWVDYLTLLKAPGQSKQEGYELISTLSKGIKGIAQRRSVIGGASAQVNRAGIQENARGNSVFLPRLEHIAYGDAIGQDSDQVFSLNRSGADLYYALVKNRHGREIGKTKVHFDVDRGIIREYEQQDDDDD